MSSLALKALRGTYDLTPATMATYQWILNTACHVSECYGFREIATPILEFKEVFQRTLGSQSDIVHKEMYVFKDKSGHEITLRPEGTAGILRAYLSRSFPERPYEKFFYRGPMFRYERPQKGRQRQFHQFGVEWIGSQHDKDDVEIISLAYDILEKLEIHNKVKLEINNIGDKESRKRYNQALFSFLSEKKEKLSSDSQRRLYQNPLRILDSKDPGDQSLLTSAPFIDEYLSSDSLSSLDSIEKSLNELNLSYTKNPFLMRGLDYYSDFVFEFKIESHESGQDAILSGGRYDDLSQMMGGPHVPAIGWAAGLDRLTLLLEKDIPLKRPLVLISLHPSGEKEAYRWMQLLRKNNFIVERFFEDKKLSWKMKRAHQIQAKAVLLLGEKEINNKEVLFKDMDSGKEQSIKTENLLETLKQMGV